MPPLVVAMVWFGYPAGKGALLFRFLTWIPYQLVMGAGKRPLFLYIYDDRRYLADCEWDLAECG
jgi:hypothetical protein